MITNEQFSQNKVSLELNGNQLLTLVALVSAGLNELVFDAESVVGVEGMNLSEKVVGSLEKFDQNSFNELVKEKEYAEVTLKVFSTFLEVVDKY